MYIFIVFSLALCFLLQTNSPLLLYFESPFVIYGGLAVAIVALACVILKKGPSKVWHDVFVSSALIVWYAYWPSIFNTYSDDAPVMNDELPMFNEDSPVFFFFPIYFVFMAAFVELFFGGRRHKGDLSTLGQMQELAKRLTIKSWALMVLVLVSLALPQHYTLYPVAVTVLLIHFELSNFLAIPD
jgi:hypothetical protein